MSIVCGRQKERHLCALWKRSASTQYEDWLKVSELQLFAIAREFCSGETALGQSEAGRGFGVAGRIGLTSVCSIVEITSLLLPKSGFLRLHRRQIILENVGTSSTASTVKDITSTPIWDSGLDDALKVVEGRFDNDSADRDGQQHCCYSISRSFWRLLVLGFRGHRWVYLIRDNDFVNSVQQSETKD